MKTRLTTSSYILVDLKLFQDVVTTGLNNLIAAEKEITKYDSIVGDGDCGIGLKRGAEGIFALGQHCRGAVAKTIGHLSCSGIGTIWSIG